MHRNRFSSNFFHIFFRTMYLWKLSWKSVYEGYTFFKKISLTRIPWFCGRVCIHICIVITCPSIKLEHPFRYIKYITMNDVYMNHNKVHKPNLWRKFRKEQTHKNFPHLLGSMFVNTCFSWYYRRCLFAMID